MTKKIKIRRLTSEKEASSENKSLKGLVYFIIGLLFGMICFYPEIIEDFVQNYEEQYNLLVHGRKDYCYRNLNIREFLAKIEKEILHQEQALEKFEHYLKNHTNFTPIAVIGTTGVGKTLFSNLLLQYFPWRQNVQYFSWSICADNYKKDLKVNKLLRRLSSCGHNVIIIDNLTPKEVSYIKNFTKKAEKVVLSTNYRLIMVYIFNIPSFMEEAETAYRNSLHHFSNLSDVKTIRFRSFNQTLLRACIKHEAKKLNVSLSEEKLLQLEKSIKANQSGCKNVYSKLGIYA